MNRFTSLSQLLIGSADAWKLVLSIGSDFQCFSSRKFQSEVCEVEILCDGT